jgi:hypothetical protein
VEILLRPVDRIVDGRMGRTLGRRTALRVEEKRRPGGRRRSLSEGHGSRDQELGFRYMEDDHGLCTRGGSDQVPADTCSARSAFTIAHTFNTSAPIRVADAAANAPKELIADVHTSSVTRAPEPTAARMRGASQ